ncbi:alkaline phosphatase family protein [Streptomyces sp. NBC_01800]|uniref:alkaline phosphatase family protein n=1 Tax=Streptomyces sp. NBC_01800 TaxID=2975945 RepID=UPI003FA35B04
MALGAGVAAGAAIPGAAGPASAAAAAVSASGTITDVKHVVILMQENRSFDHYFGRLKGVRGFSDRAAITLPGGQSVFSQPNGLGRQYPWKLSATPAVGGADGETLAQCNGDLPHSWSSQHAAWNKGRLDSWVSGVGNVRTLGYLDRGDIPYHYALADNYTICDGYFSSALSATGPNRTYRARALPYQTNGNLDRLEFGTAGKILAWFSMANQGAPARSAAHLSVQPTAYRSTEPWQYTVDAGGTASDYLNIGTGYGDGKYDITMTGPNRFLRRFTGDATKPG